MPESQEIAHRRSPDCRHRWAADDAEPGDALDYLAARLDQRPLFYFEHPQAQAALVACGEAHAIRSSGAGRFAEAAREARLLGERLCPSGADGPPLVGGFGFAPDAATSMWWREFPPLWMFLPLEALVRRGNRVTRYTVEPCGGLSAASPGASSAGVQSAASLAKAVGRLDCSASVDVGHAHVGESEATGAEDRRWRERVERVLSDIASGRVRKVVLSRSISGSLVGSADVIAMLRRLRETRPGCYTFLIAAGETVFLGSTPELLVRRSREWVETQSLAGTIGRAADERVDRESAAALQASDKDAREHLEVTRGILEALGPVTEDLEVAPRPRILEVPEAYHLHTPIRGRLKTAASALDLAGLLHPTPAVCGMPRAETARRLAAEEPDRGWYSGAVGWMDPSGDGEFAVALRSALLDRGRYVCWAGAGIVAGSEPEAELAETETKMRAARSALLQDRP
ncbi:MAG: isochorismate synthase [Deltaproteobacteria bacterium]|nr:MAG: isochorismate synthase [Deltaproteobacteria bacterium]